MNVNNNINKLLKALSLKNQIYKINSFKFYSEKNLKYCNKYQVLKKEIVEDQDENLIEKYILKCEYYSKIDILKYLISELQGSEVNE